MTARSGCNAGTSTVGTHALCSRYILPLLGWAGTTRCDAVHMVPLAHHCQHLFTLARYAMAASRSVERTCNLTSGAAALTSLKCTSQAPATEAQDGGGHAVRAHRAAQLPAHAGGHDLQPGLPRRGRHRADHRAQPVHNAGRRCRERAGMPVLSSQPDCWSLRGSAYSMRASMSARSASSQA